MSKRKAVKMNGPTPMLRVKDMKKTLAFYRDDLGLKVLETFAPGGKIAWACLGSKEGGQLMLHTGVAGQKAAERNHTIYYFKPDDVIALHRRLRHRGKSVSKLTVTIYRMREFSMKDPDGRTLTFGQLTRDVSDTEES